MKNSKLRIQNWQLLFCIVYFAFCFSAVNAQSTRIEFPTPLTSSEINGRIPARDIGDSRLTSYYYTFNGNQGDIFLRIQSANLNGDIDVFYADNMRPLTKISLYADSSEPTQTGREIYLRKPEKLILRVEGRTPNDDAATFSIKFEGSFQPLTAANSADEPENPTIKNEIEGTVRVNSVGTIIEPESKPEPKRAIAGTSKKNVKTVTTPKSISTADENDESATSDEENLNRSRVVISDNLPEKTETKLPAKKNTTAKKTPARRTTRAAARRTPPAKTAAETKTEELAKALENVRLIVLFKDGEKIERPMNEVLRFNIDKGVLTIIAKDGAIGRYSILDVIKVAIE